jgi:hypothetical protein
MKMKPTLKILVCVLAAGSAWAQSPSIIQNTRNTMNAVSSNSTAASNEALGNQQSEPVAVTRSHAPVVAPTPVAHTPVAHTSVAHTSVKANGTATATAAKPKAAGPVIKPSTEAKKVPVVSVRAAAKPKAPIVAPKKNPATARPGAVATVSVAAATDESAGSDTSLAPDSKYAANGRRDPFISPVVSHAGGPSCTSGKKCLEIGTVNLRGVVHGQSGFIAVVSNGLNKAYFLRENDPVFNGYVMKITGDSIVFQETLQDRLGKSFTREVVKKITTPAV